MEIEEPMSLSEHLAVIGVVLVIYIPGLLVTWRVHRRDRDRALREASVKDHTELTASSPDDWEDSDDAIDDSDLMALLRASKPKIE